MNYRTIGCVMGLMLLSGCGDVFSALFVTPTNEVSLWPGGAPGSEGKNGPEREYQRHEAATKDTPDVTFNVVTDINNPTITVFQPVKEKATGAAVIILPGGGHMFLSIDHEGYDVAKAFAERGVTGIVLKYRLARAEGSTYQVKVESLMDTQRAIRVVRAKAEEWEIDPKRVGVLGFSAGGELALLAATEFEHPVPGSKTLADSEDCRPDFVGLMYPGGLNDPASIVIPKNMPPTFICCTATDRPTISDNTAIFFERLREKNIPAELHIYGSGGHGWGVRETGRPVENWPDRFVAWMKDQGMIK
jgi:endo-1,4-beta-xylanase